MKKFCISLLFSVLAISAYCQNGSDSLSVKLTRASEDYEGGVYWASTPDSLYVLVDSTGKILTKVKYQKVYPFQDGIAYVMRNASIGFVNISGQEVGRCIFDYAPVVFGYSQFVYRKGSERINLMHNPSTGYVWVSETGKMLFFTKKTMFTLKDKIPNALWDY